MKRVVVTGLGMVTPLACGVEATWRRLLAGESGARGSRASTFPTSLARSRRRCRAAARPTRSIPTSGWSRRSSARSTISSSMRVAAATQALSDANWAPKTYDEQIESGVLIGSGIGGLTGIYEASITLHEKGPRRISPFFIPGRLINLASGQVSIPHGLKGPNHAVVTACSTGAHAIGDAARLIALGDANVMVAGGAESAVNRLALAGFAACRALSTGFNDRPKQASRPYDRDRDGFVMGEGAGCVGARGTRARQGARRAHLRRTHRLRPVGRRLSHHRARARRRRRLSRDDGGAEARRPHGGRHRLRQRPRHLDDGATRSSCARSSACSATRRRTPTMSSTKSSIGHLLGAAGAVEAIFSILAIRDQIAPPTLNLDNPSVETAIDLDAARRQAREDQRRAVEFVRLRRHQRVDHLPRPAGVSLVWSLKSDAGNSQSPAMS